MHGSQTRFVELVDHDGKAICAPIFVEIDELPYVISDAEWELRAIALAIQDGLLEPRCRGSVHANFAITARA